MRYKIKRQSQTPIPNDGSVIRRWRAFNTLQGRQFVLVEENENPTNYCSDLLQ
jgi:hypothetical protein